MGAATFGAGVSCARATATHAPTAITAATVATARRDALIGTVLLKERRRPVGAAPWSVSQSSSNETRAGQVALLLLLLRVLREVRPTSGKLRLVIFVVQVGHVDPRVRHLVDGAIAAA